MTHSTLAGALKAYLEAQGLGIAVFADAPPPGTPKAGQIGASSYCTVAEDIAMTMDGYEDAAASTGTEMVQVDLWQTWKDADDKRVESPTLPNALTRLLHGAALPTAPTRVYGVLQRNRIRLLERDANLVHHAFTLDVKRVI